MMKNSALVLIIIIALGFLNQKVEACTRGQVTIENIFPVHIDFSSTPTQIISLNVVHAAPTTDCITAIVADYGNATTWTNRFMQVNPLDIIDFNIHKTFPVTGANTIRDQGDVTNSNQYIAPFAFVASAGATTRSSNFIAQLGTVSSMSPPGLYTEAIVLKLLSDINPSALPVTAWSIIHERAIAFNYYIPAIIDVAIVPTGGSFDSLSAAYFMNFEELEIGENQAADIMVQTNSGYRLSVSSLNDGVLRNTTSSSATIGYTFTANGSPVSLVGTSLSPIEISSNASPHTGGGYRIPITATINTFSNSLQGAYQDTLSLNVSAF